MERVRNKRSPSDNFKFSLLCFIFLGICASFDLTLADPGVDATPTEIEKKVLKLINIERQKNGLHPLLWDKQLYDAAQSHSEDMASENYFSHASLNEKKYTDRIREAGYDDAMVSENIGAGQSSARQIFDAWRTSNDLREDMLDISYCDAAVGHSLNEDSDWTNYWTLDMGRKSSMEQCVSIDPAPEPEVEPESEPEPELDRVPESVSTADEPDFCEELIQRHEAFCKNHPELCRAALMKCKRSQ